MEAIFDYIAEKLKAPDIALHQYNRIADAILTLNVCPERHALFASQPEHDMGCRPLTVDNYSAIYVVTDDAVTVLRVLYSASDIAARLRSE